MLRIFYNQQFTKYMVIDDKEKIHHLSTVLRIKTFDEVYLVNGSEVAKTIVRSVSKARIELEMVEVFKESNELTKELTLGFAPLKGDNTQFVIQKAVELGVVNIDLVNFKRNISKFDGGKAEKKLQKFNKIIEGACNQSRRNIQPQIDINVSLTSTYLSSFDLVIACFENESSNHLLSYTEAICCAKSILLLIGPEGGIEEGEIEALAANHNVRVATLGKRILRAETASICGLSIIGSIIEGKQ